VVEKNIKHQKRRKNVENPKENPKRKKNPKKHNFFYYNQKIYIKNLKLIYILVMTDKRELVENVKKWIGIDNDIKELQKVMREKRKEKKLYTQSLVDIMKTNDIDCFDMKSGKLIYTKKTVKAPLSKKHLFESLTKYFQNNKELCDELGQFILETRKEKIKENIRRKV
tara:strand:+ start:431 stop:934 length:504 start_codon:yes stop_codon:yes gene_type:complete